MIDPKITLHGNLVAAGALIRASRVCLDEQLRQDGAFRRNVSKQRWGLGHGAHAVITHEYGQTYIEIHTPIVGASSRTQRWLRRWYFAMAGNGASAAAPYTSFYNSNDGLNWMPMNLPVQFATQGQCAVMDMGNVVFIADSFSSATSSGGISAWVINAKGYIVAGPYPIGSLSFPATAVPDPYLGVGSTAVPVVWQVFSVSALSPTKALILLGGESGGSYVATFSLQLDIVTGVFRGGIIPGVITTTSGYTLVYDTSGFWHMLFTGSNGYVAYDAITNASAPLPLPAFTSFPLDFPAETILWAPSSNYFPYLAVTSQDQPPIPAGVTPGAVGAWAAGHLLAGGQSSVTGTAFYLAPPGASTWTFAGASAASNGVAGKIVVDDRQILLPQGGQRVTLAGIQSVATPFLPLLFENYAITYVGPNWIGPPWATWKVPAAILL